MDNQTYRLHEEEKKEKYRRRRRRKHLEMHQLSPSIFQVNHVAGSQKGLAFEAFFFRNNKKSEST